MRMTIFVSVPFRFGLTTIYLFAIQYVTHIGGKISVGLIKHENNENKEKRADSLVYKVFSRNWYLGFYSLLTDILMLLTGLISLQVFGLYFMQSYIGIFYHALLHRSFLTLRQVLIQRLLVSEVIYMDSIWSKYSYLLYGLMCLNFATFARCWKTCWRILYLILNIVTRNIESGELLFDYHLLTSYIVGYTL